MIQLKNAYGAYAGTLTPKTSDMKIPQVFHGINAEVDAPPPNDSNILLMPAASYEVFLLLSIYFDIPLSS